MKWLAAAMLVKSVAHIPVLLPQFLPPAYTQGFRVTAIVEKRSPTYYSVDFAADPNCNGAHVCSIAHAIGSAVPLPLGYTASTCAAYCNDASLTWRAGAYYYSVSLKAGSLSDLRAVAHSMQRY